MRTMALLILLVLAGCSTSRVYLIPGQSNGTNGTGDNASWNEGLADGLYYPLSTNPLSFYNSTTLPTYPTPDNASWNEGLADGLYYPLYSNPNGYLTSYTESDPKTATMPNLTYAQIATNIGNWSADKSSYVTITNMNAAVGQNLTMAGIKNNMGNASQLAGNCGAGNVLQNITFIGGTFALQCAADQTGAAGYSSSSAGWDNTTTTITTNGTKNVTINGTLSLNGRITTQDNLYVYGGVENLHAQAYFCDFNAGYSVGGCSPAYLGIVTGTGGIAAADSFGISNNTFGVWSLSQGTAAPSGYRVVMDPLSLLLFGKEEFKAKIAINNSRPGNSSLTFAGFVDNTAVATDPVDGAYWRIFTNSTHNGLANASCLISNNSVRVASINYTMLTRYWYEFSVTINSTATGATCRILNASSGQILFEANLSGALPYLPGRETGAGITSGSGGTAPVSAHIVSFVDYILVEVERVARYLT